VILAYHNNSLQENMLIASDDYKLYKYILRYARAHTHRIFHTITNITSKNKN